MDDIILLFAGLMAANLVGFVVGVDGLKPLLADIVSQPVFIVTSFSVFYSAAQVHIHAII